MRRLAKLLLGLLGVLLLLAAGGLVWLTNADLAPFVQANVERFAGRKLAMDSLHLRLGRTVRLALVGLRVPSVQPGAPDLATAAEVEAVVDALPLLHGRLVVRSLAIQHLSVMLKRDADGVGNWRGKAEPAPGEDAPATLPPLLDVSLQDGTVVYIGSSGKPFTIALSQATIQGASPADPVQLAAQGTLGGIPVALQAALGSYDALRDRPKPFPMKLTLTSGRSTLVYEGTATDPLAMDGLDGTATLDVPSLRDLLRTFGTALAADAPAALSGKLVAQGGDWLLSGARGTVDREAFTGELHYVEGSQGAPDSVNLQLRFDALDASRLLSLAPSGGGGGGELPEAGPAPDPLLEVQLDAKQASYAGHRATNLDVHVVQEPGRLALEQAVFNFAGGRVLLVAAATPAPGGTRLVASAALDGTDVRQVAHAAGMSAPPLSGPLSARMQADVTGRTWTAALAHGQVSAAAGMWSGSIARSLVRMASLDVGSLFTDGAEYTRLYCLIAVASLRNGAGPLSPVRIMTPDGTVGGGGQLNLPRGLVDAVLQSDSRTTGALALDLPITIRGALSGPTVRPGTGTDRRAFSDQVGPLPPDMLRFVRSNPCARGR